MDKINLLEFTKNAGCSCKIAPKDLQQILQTSNGIIDPNLLIGNSSADDAAVYAINETDCIISTTDFFTPIHNDAYTYGAIAAANALSDVYAMGGTPIMATAILAWPTEKLGTDIAQQVLQGAIDTCSEAGIPLAGGHSVLAPEPLFGLNVTGTIKKQNIKQNNTAQVGDVLFLTKPIGLGIYTSALKRNELLPEDLNVAEQWMQQLNSFGTLLGQQDYVTALTDITGFGLAGHLIELCDKGRVSVALHWNQIPVLNNVDYYIKKGIKPDATFRNWNSYSAEISYASGLPVMDIFSLLPDPQTSGGLCIAVKPEAVDAFIQLCQQHDCPTATKPIGTVIAAAEKSIYVI